MAWHSQGRRQDLQGLRIAALAWAEARVYVAVAFVVTDAVLGRYRTRPEAPIDLGLLAWDGDWYRRIAEVGYAAGDDPAVRFFPLWPLLGRWAGTVLGGPEIALVVLANLFALACGVLLYRLTLAETGDTRTAASAVRLFSLFPSAFVLVLGYSEALFVMLALAMLTCLRSGRWWSAAALGYLAGLTRPVGALLGLSAAVSMRRAGRLGSPGAWAALLSGAAGSATYVVFCGLALDDPWAPFDRQRELRGGFAEPFSRLITALADGIRGDEGEAFHFLAVLCLVGLAVMCVRRLSPELWVYAVASTLLMISVENLNSTGRYALAAFPLVIAAAVVSRRPLLDRRLATASAVGMTALCMLALGGVYVP